MELTSTLRDVSVIISIWVAIYSINAWRREHVGKRQLELAEDTLALFYQAADAIHHIRSPFGLSDDETKDIERKSGESDTAYEARKMASAVFVRYGQHQELFSRIHAMRYRFMAQIGKEKAKPFQDLHNINSEIIISARMLSRLWARFRFKDDEDSARHSELLAEHEAVFWDGYSEADPINPKLEKVVEEIEETCRKVIKGKGTFCGVFNLGFWRT